MTRPQLLPAALLLLCLLPPIAAQGNLLQASEAHIGGNGDITADLAGVWALETPLAQPTLVSLTVQEGNMILNERSVEVYTNKVGVTPAQSSTTTTQLRPANASQFQFGAQMRLIVLGQADRTDLQASAGESIMVPSAADRSFESRGASGQWVVPSKGTIELRGGSSMLTVSGTFQLMVWDATFTLTNATGSQEIRTGANNEPLQGAPPGGPVSRHVQREAVFQVTNGTLLLPREAAFHVYASTVTIDLHSGSVDALKPSGPNPVDGAEIAQGSRDLNLSAPLKFTTKNSANGLSLEFLSPPNQANLDGRVILAPAGAKSWLPWTIAGLLAVPFLGVVAVKTRNHQHFGLSTGSSWVDACLKRPF